MRKHWLWGLIVCLWITACGAPQSTSPATPPTLATGPTATATPAQTAISTPADSIACPRSTVKGIVSLNSVSLPEHLRGKEAAKTGEEFDVNRYFSVLTHLSMQPGYVLDYTYYWYGMGGQPILYARPASEPGYRTYDKFHEETGTSLSSRARFDYLNHIEIDGTQDGFVEFAILRILGGQFYLFWHAGYNDVQIICDRAQIQTFVSNVQDCTEHDWNCMTQEHKQQALALSVEPTVHVEPDTVTVGLVTFSKWGGYSRRSYTINREFPHAILEETATNLIPFDCGIEF